MNRSGQPVATAKGFYKLALSNLLVITDDMALEPGRIRIRPSGSAGGHNGLADIIENKAIQDMEKMENEARAEYNKAVPKAKGEAESVLFKYKCSLRIKKQG